MPTIGHSGFREINRTRVVIEILISFLESRIV